MTLTLLAVSLNEQPLSQPITACFDANGGTIGRADHNTMALPDPERHISRLQAEIIGTGSGYTIKNVGAANPIIIGNRTLVQGESAPLSDRDQVRVGGYLLQVVVDSDDDARGADITRGRAAIAAGETPALRSTAWVRDTTPPGGASRPGAAPGIGSLADVATPLSSDNPFADLIGGPPVAAPVQPTPAAAPVPTAFARPAPGRPAGDTFADLMPAPAGIPRSSQALGATPPAPAQRLPDDFDPFAAPPAPRADPLPAVAARGGAFDDLIPSAAPSSLDDVYGLRPSAGTDPLANFMAGMPAAGPGAPAAAPVAGGLSVDPLALFGGSDRPAPARAPSAANHTPDLLAGFVPPQVVPPPTLPPAPSVTPRALPPASESAHPVLPTRFDWQVNPAARPSATLTSEAITPPRAAPPPVDFELGTSQPHPLPAGAVSPLAPPAPAPVATAAPTPPAVAPAHPAAPAAFSPVVPPQPAQSVAGADNAALWQAFCEGAGIDPAMLPGLNPALMRDVGGVLRAAVEGTLQLIAVRATTKHELRANVTVIQARNNNPLKFSPDASSGIEQLLRPTMRGFLAGPAAMTDAMNDLVGHSIGTVAGMRSALEGMLGRFAPQQLESKMVGQSLLDSVLPMNRKAKLWELYLQHFETIREEAQEDFHTLFGKAFLAAYEQQLERLKRDANPG